MATYKSTSTDTMKREVAAIQRALDDRAAAIRSDDVYTDAGRRIELARATHKATERAEELKRQFVAERASRRHEVEQSLFGHTGTPTAAQVTINRDAHDRADRITSPEEALVALQRCRQTGDDTLSRAVAQRALSRGWTEAVGSYADNADESTRALLQELSDIPSGPRTNVADAILFSIRKPGELGGISPDDLRKLATHTTVTKVLGREETSPLGQGPIGVAQGLR